MFFFELLSKIFYCVGDILRFFIIGRNIMVNILKLVENVLEMLKEILFFNFFRVRGLFKSFFVIVLLMFNGY